jgi:small GTP-binding protein
MATRLKIVLLGEAGVGKTALLLRYVEGHYDEKTKTTLAIDIINKKIIQDGDVIDVSFWDTAGQDSTLTLMSNILHRVNIIMLCLCEYNRESFQLVDTWIKHIRQAGIDNILLVGTKNEDLKDRSFVREYFNLPFVNTSAKTGKGVEEAFTTAINIAQTFYIEELTRSSPLELEASSKRGRCLC